ncbi:MAG: SDR family oxidoreductase [Planctomycetes bacterium]|nr:SDR family oxidoreductase [Planctomycetota bacterium]
MTPQKQTDSDSRPSTDRPLAIVTGGARRVGRAICLALARQGFDVVLTYRTSRAEAEDTCRQCRSNGVWARSHHLDLSNVHHTEECSKSLLGEFPEIDLLVHCAGQYEASKWGDVTADSLESHYRVNVTTPVLMLQTLAPALRASGGSVVLFGDIHASGRPRNGYLAYSLSKSAVEASVRLLALELAPEIRVNGIAPGVIAWPEDTASDERDAYEQRIPLKRAGTPEDAAALVVFLACNAAYVTGEIIALDGGRRLC